MNAVCEITDAMAASISGLIDSYCVFRSTNGMLAVAVSSVCMMNGLKNGIERYQRFYLSAFNEGVRELGDLTDNTCRITDDDGAGGHVANHDGTGADERALSNRHARQQRDVGADDGAPADDWASQAVLHPIGRAHV